MSANSTAPSPSPAAEGRGPLLEVDQLQRLFPVRRSLGEVVARRQHAVHAVDTVSFRLAPGEIIALLGESGCGKSTTGRLIARLDTPTGGAIRFEGRNVAALDATALKAFRRRVQIVFQNPFECFDPRQTIGAALQQPLTIHRLGGSAAEQRALIVAALERAGIVPAEDFLGRFPHELSGGQLQRIATVRVMLLEPALLVADEPVSMLDVSVRAEILNQLLDLRDERGMAIVFITHDIAVARYVADRVGVMYLGMFVETGPADEVIGHPHHPYTRALLSHTLPVGEEIKGEPFEIQGDPPTPIDLQPGCRFAGRCPLVFDRCRVETPALRPVAAGHQAACHLFPEPPAPAT